MARLGDFCDINMGQSPDSSSYNDAGQGLPFYQGNADFGVRYPTPRVYCSQPCKIAHKGDVLISVRAPIGALNIANETCCIGRGLAAIAIDENKCSKEYFWYAIAAKVDELNAKGTGSTFKAISKSVLFDTNIVLPALNEQKKAYGCLSLVDELISLRKKQLQKLDDLVKSRFVEMFGDPNTNPMGWTEYPLSEMLNILGGYAFRSEGFCEADGIPVLRIGNINAGFFKPVNMVFWEEDESLERYIMYPGDLVMSLTGTVGKDDYGNVCMLGNDYDKYYLNQRNAKLELKEGLDKHYLSQLLRFEKIKKRLTGISRGVRQANISNKDILGLRVPIPPIALQWQYATFVTQVDKSKLTVQQGLDKLELLKQSLMQKYFG